MVIKKTTILNLDIYKFKFICFKKFYSLSTFRNKNLRRIEEWPNLTTNEKFNITKIEEKMNPQIEAPNKLLKPNYTILVLPKIYASFSAFSVFQLFQFY